MNQTFLRTQRFLIVLFAVFQAPLALHVSHCAVMEDMILANVNLFFFSNLLNQFLQPSMALICSWGLERHLLWIFAPNFFLVGP